jgi:trigger factor
LNTQLHERSQVERELEIFVDEAELQKAFDEAYKTVRPRLSLPGFRPGKAPMSFVKKMHGDSIEGDALEKLAQEKFREAMEEHKIEPIGQPVMTDLHRHTGEGAHFKIMYEIAPTIDLVDFSGMEVEKKILSITDEDVQDRIDRLRFSQSGREPADVVEDNQAIVTIDMKEVEVPEGREAGKSEGIEIYLSDPEILPEIQQALMGKKVGDTATIELPRNQRQKGEENKEDEDRGKVEVTVKSIQKVLLPALDEEFIKKVSENELSTEEELRTKMKEELEKATARRSDAELEERMVGQILEKHEFEVPRTITNAILDQMLEEARQENTRRGFPANYGIEERDYRDRMWPMAEARGKWVLLREKLIEAEDIKATDEDLEKLAEEEAAKYGLAKENLLKYYQKYDSVKNRIVSEKLGTRLREKVKVTEKPVERSSK